MHEPLVSHLPCPWVLGIIATLIKPNRGYSKDTLSRSRLAVRVYHFLTARFVKPHVDTSTAASQVDRHYTDKHHPRSNVQQLFRIISCL